MVECICGKDGHPINSTACPIHGTWRPIETAPYGHVLGWVSFGEGRGAHFIVHKDDADMWCDDNDDQLGRHYKVTHWMPLPEPPALNR